MLFGLEISKMVKFQEDQFTFVSLNSAEACPTDVTTSSLVYRAARVTDVPYKQNSRTAVPFMWGSLRLAPISIYAHRFTICVGLVSAHPNIWWYVGHIKLLRIFTVLHSAIFTCLCYLYWCACSVSYFTPRVYKIAVLLR